jgi:DivIVA domain-containing protein
MGQLLLFIVVALVVGAIVFGVTVMMSGGDSGLTPVEPDGAALPLPSDRPLGEEDVIRTRFDTAVRGYRMSQVDQALQRAAYDIGYKGELIGVLEAEVTALREGRLADADVLRRAREAAVAPPPQQSAPAGSEVAAGVEGSAGVEGGAAGVEGSAGVEGAEPEAAAEGPIEVAADVPPDDDARATIEATADDEAKSDGEPVERR